MGFPHEYDITDYNPINKLVEAQKLVAGIPSVIPPPSALDKVLNERKQQHGDFKVQFKIAQDLKRALGQWRSHVNDQQAEAIEQICHKLSRIVTGDPTHADHWRDIAGYATLIQNMLEGKQW